MSDLLDYTVKWTNLLNDDDSKQISVVSTYNAPYMEVSGPDINGNFSFDFTHASQSYRLTLAPAQFADLAQKMKELSEVKLLGYDEDEPFEFDIPEDSSPGVPDDSGIRVPQNSSPGLPDKKPTLRAGKKAATVAK